MKTKVKCQQCKKKFVVKNKHTRNVKFCSILCRNRSYQPRVTEWGRKYRDKMAIPGDNKIKCKYCGKWYIQVGSHVVQRHGFETAREYRIYYDLDRKRGLTAGDYRKRKGNAVFQNGTVKNLNKGKKYWFVVNDPKAGKYIRSKETINRLKKLYLFNKNCRKKYRLV